MIGTQNVYQGEYYDLGPKFWLSGATWCREFSQNVGSSKAGSTAIPEHFDTVGPIGMHGGVLWSTIFVKLSLTSMCLHSKNTKLRVPVPTPNPNPNP